MISIGAPFPQPCLVIVSVAPEMPMGGYPALAPMAIVAPAASCAVGILPIVSKSGGVVFMLRIHWRLDARTPPD